MCIRKLDSHAAMRQCTEKKNAACNKKKKKESRLYPKVNSSESFLTHS